MLDLTDPDVLDIESTDAIDDARLGQRRYPTLTAALTERMIPLENHALITRAADGIGIALYLETSTYIRAVRREGGPDIRIAWGWTNGFRSEDEILTLVGDVQRWRSGRKGLWGVTHPVNRAWSGEGASSRHVQREYAICRAAPSCSRRTARAPADDRDAAHSTGR